MPNNPLTAVLQEAVAFISAHRGIGAFEGNLTADVTHSANVSDTSDLEGALDLQSGHNPLWKCE